MKKYFYINDFQFDCTKTRLEKVKGYFTDADHHIFNPSQDLSRDEAVQLLHAGIVLFLHDGCYRQVFVRLVDLNSSEYLRVGNYTHPSDCLE